MLTTEQYKQLDSTLIEELNIQGIARRVAETDDGTLVLVYDGKDYRFMIGDKDVTTPKLLETIPEILEAMTAIPEFN